MVGKHVRVTSLSICGFRGFPQSISLAFGSTAGAPSSWLIYGDNGTGKSSILDAIEFALQARVGRSQRLRPENGPSIPSLAARTLPEVAVTLSDGSTCKRRVIRAADDSLCIDSSYVRPEFSLAPICLKRADIVRFLDRPAEERAMVFSDYFTAPRQPHILVEDSEHQIRERRIELKARRRTVAAALGEKLGAVVPMDKGKLRDFKKLHLHRGIDPDEAKRRGFRITTTIDASVERDFQELDSLTTQLHELTLQQAAFKSASRPRGLAHISGALASISHELTQSFLEITRAHHVQSVQVRYGEMSAVSLEIVVELENGRRCTPQQVFSEGLQDLLSLLFFFAVLKEASKHGQQRILLLDDVFQSVDSVIRSGVMRYVLREFREWQMFVTVHDRLWRELLRDLFRGASVRLSELEVRRWEFQHGPLIASPGILVDGLNNALERGDPASICAEAGRLMELVADKLSWTIGSSVVRRREDKYTLGDLWPGVRKTLKGSSIEKESNDVNQHLVLRNLMGAHYNEWAGSLSDSEVRDFGQSVRAFVDKVYCESCVQIVELKDGIIRCRCTRVTVTLK